MQHLFLTSSIGTNGVGKSIRQRIGHDRPLRTVFITTPLEPSSEQEDLSWVDADRLGLANNNFVAFNYTVTGKNLAQIKDDLKDIDALYASGGNTNYLLQESQKSGFIEFVQEFVQSGKPYIGTSAGSICAGVDIAANSRPGKSHLDYSLESTKGFGLVNFCILPHWGQPSKKADHLTYKVPQSYKSDYPYILLSNYQYIAVTDSGWQIIDTKNSNE